MLNSPGHEKSDLELQILPHVHTEFWEGCGEKICHLFLNIDLDGQVMYDVAAEFCKNLQILKIKIKPYPDKIFKLILFGFYTRDGGKIDFFDFLSIS